MKKERLKDEKMIKVLIVEDSPVVRELLIYILGSDPGIELLGTAENGEKAVEFVKRTMPDVITMDINMPKMNGLEATRTIMETNPVPIVIVSGSWDVREVDTTFKAMEAGAVAAVQRPVGIGHPEHEANKRELLQTIRLMSEIRVVKRWPHYQKTASPETPAIPASSGAGSLQVPSAIRAVAIGASTGGPPALQTILSGLKSKMSPPLLPPILIVQHITTGFLDGMVAWLSKTSSVPLHIAKQGDPLMQGHAFFAPDGFNMGVDGSGNITLTSDREENSFCPSVSFLFRSVANVFGRNAVGILLTGMGKDGAEELKLMKEKGAVTIAQDRESSVVYGMPGEAARLGAAMYTLSPGGISGFLAELGR